MSRQLVSANHAAGKAATLAGRANRTAKGFGAGVYPITPQTECIEFLCKQEFDKGHVVRVESEHSAMGVCIGFSSAGARSFTASSSNGLAYMAENIIAAANYRLPIVMMAVNRTLGPPWNIWVDHSDTLMLRDTGWMQFYCEDNQEVADTVLAAFRLAEDPRVLLPAMVCQDAFVLSHTMMLTDFPPQEQVDEFLPDLDLGHALGTEPRVIGGLDFPHDIEVHRHQHQEAMEAVFEVYPEVQAAFLETFGRPLADPLVPYRLEDAELVLVSMGTTACTVRMAVDAARERGLKVGALRVRMFRPFPEEQIVGLLAGIPRVGVIDRDLSPGLGGILWGEIRGCLDRDVVLQNYMVGLGGGDIRPEHIEELLEDLAGRQRAGKPLFKEVA